jgi:hypothetical protein
MVMGSITADFATGKEAVVTRVDHEYGYSAPKSARRMTSRVIGIRFSRSDCSLDARASGPSRIKASQYHGNLNLAGYDMMPAQVGGLGDDARQTRMPTFAYSA